MLDCFKKPKVYKLLRLINTIKMVKKRNETNDSIEAKVLLFFAGLFIFLIFLKAIIYSGTMLHGSTETEVASFWLLMIIFIASKTFKFGKYVEERLFG